MTQPTLQGHAGGLHVCAWESPNPTHVIVIAHGYGEHIGRYDHVASAFTETGAVVYGLDHVGHGRSGGERALITDLNAVVDDLHRLIERVRDEHSALPVVLVGHSLGGLIATRYGELAALVLSAPLVGSHSSSALLAMDPLPEIPVDPSVLSRDESVQRAYVNDPLVYHGPFKRPTVAAIAAGLLDAALDSQLVTGPVLWQHGEADQLVPVAGSQRLIELLTRAQVTRRHYPEARHEIFNEMNRDEVLRDTTQFVAEALAR